MDEPIESAYFKWLRNKIEQVEIPTPSLTHWNLLQRLHNTEFVWLLSGDDNRAQDGLDLRHEFLRYKFISVDYEWEVLGCSLLEMLIAFARRTAFQTDISERDWFWIFIRNLGLEHYDDSVELTPTVDTVIFNLIWRQYDASGDGGLFPLKNPQHDQREVELWYQFCEYLMDQDE